MQHLHGVAPGVGPMIAVVMAPLMLFFAVEELSQSTDDAPTWMSSLGRLESEHLSLGESNLARNRPLMST